VTRDLHQVHATTARAVVRVRGAIESLVAQGSAPRQQRLRRVRRLGPARSAQTLQGFEVQSHGGEEVAQVVDNGGAGVPQRGVVRGDDELWHGLDLVAGGLRCMRLRYASNFEHETGLPANADCLLHR